jgi:hypothetical protein
MPLPPPGPNIRWTDYRIDTPTFSLSPVEKPDMSPHLVHMTGKDAIAKILRGEGSPVQLARGNGFLMAVVPSYEGQAEPIFTRPVVCFTESPTFALDFFRYRSYRRWNDDQRFGIGFHKGKLAERGVRPVLYLDAEMRAYLRSLARLGEAAEWRLSASDAVNKRMRALVEGLIGFVFPLLEDHPYEGFMWEREWRAGFAEGFPFAHTDIEIICCPADEETEIREILGGGATVRFVRTWLEYDDVTSFLQHREDLQQPYQPLAPAGQPLPARISAVEKQRTLHEVAIHSLEGYVMLSEQIAAKADLARRELDALKEKKQAIDAELAQLVAERRREDEKNRAAEAGAPQQRNN